MSYIGTYHGFKTVKAESCNQRDPVNFDEDIFTPWSEVSYEEFGSSYTLRDGTSVTNNSGGGGFKGSQLKIFGHDYNGSQNTKHRPSKDSIFFKVGPKVRSNKNPYSTGNFTNTNEMFPTSIALYSDARNNGNTYGGGFTCIGNKGYPFPVRGISFDYFIHKDMAAISGAGTNHKLSSGAAEKFYTRQQINKIWGIWYQYNTGKYICKELTPNGDNWGGRENSNLSEGKYIFRNSDSFKKGAGDEIMRPEKNYPGGKEENQDKGVYNKIFRIRAMINKQESPPSNSVFLGFHWQHSYGTSSDGKKKIFNVSNVQIIDPMSAELFYDNPAYHGFNPRESPYSIIRPELYKTSNLINKDDPIIALHKISTTITEV
jgi:hypothetical protein